MLLGPQTSSISTVSRILLLVGVSVHASVTVCSSTGALGLMGSSCPMLLEVLLSRASWSRSPLLAP